MRGHIAKKNSRYYVVVDVGRDQETNKRKQKWHGGFRTRKDAEAELTKILNSLQENTYVASTKQTVGQFMDEWLPAIKSTVRPTTWESYRGYVHGHIKPKLGQTLLKRLTPSQLNTFYADLLESGSLKGRGGLSPRTVRYIHTILHRAMRDAVRWGRITRNPTEQADPPKQSRPEMDVWTGLQLRAFLTSVQGHRMYPLFLLASTTGMRRGELCGLRWEDVDLDAGRIQVRQTLVNIGDYKVEFSQPKTKRSRRSIALDPATVSALRSHRTAQMEERLAWGPAYEETGLVFTQENGSLLHPDSVSSLFKRLSARAGLPVIRFHDLRHTYATVALGAGTHPKVVSDRLGHASISITLDTYSHVIAGVGEEAANSVAALILGNG